MNYPTACWRAITTDWRCDVSADSITGNGFQIALYGLFLILTYVLMFVFRVMFAILFPLTAIIVLNIQNRHCDDPDDDL